VKIHVDEEVCFRSYCMTWTGASGSSCCGYNQWQRTSSEYWATEATDPGGKISYAPDVSIPCSCGTLFEIIEAMPSTGEMLKGDAFKSQAVLQCPGLTISAAVDMVKACKLGDDSTIVGVNDWPQLFHFLVGFISGKTGDTGPGWSMPPQPVVPGVNAPLERVK